ncbi:MAG: imidazolonepropionase [Bacteroidetes bacterium]|jgi:imidazolonepropionase|nr:imidazolonepropionase [Bacteroidota bacterium]
MKVFVNIKKIGGVSASDVSVKKGKEMSEFEMLENTFMVVKNGRVAEHGQMREYNADKFKDYEIIDVKNRIMMPGWCDSHTHLVYAASREEEFVDRIKGLTYEAIAKRGGGILNSAKKLAAATEEELFQSACERIRTMIAKGTTCIEIKSGYGLSFEGEMKMLRVIKRIKEHFPLLIKSTFLGAHAVPEQFKNNKQGYIDVLTNELMPAIQTEKLADFCDVFCEQNYFSREETIHILNAGKKYGMTPKVHANQMSYSGGVQAGVACGAISVDHLEYVGDEEINILKNSKTMPVVLPGAAFFLGLPLPPARKMIDAGLPIAVATDFNPGSSPSGDMNFMISLLCIQYKLTPEEAFNAATINAAYAMDAASETGNLGIGKRADFFITKQIPSTSYIPYSFNENTVEEVYVSGNKIH